jgi:hypothetical protein
MIDPTRITILNVVPLENVRRRASTGAGVELSIKPANRSQPNCPFCCNFSSAVTTGVYNEPLGGPWRGTDPYNVTRFGHNTLGDGQLFWDFRNEDVQDHVAKNVFFGAAANAYVDGIFSAHHRTNPISTICAYTPSYSWFVRRN